MTDSNQIRINELARELEVKAKAIIDYLPEAGVTEKKTHSSSIEVEAAVKVREHFRALAEEEAQEEQKAIADKAAKDAAARAARMKPAAVAPPPPPAAIPAPPAPVVSEPRAALPRLQPAPSKLKACGDCPASSGSEAGGRSACGARQDCSRAKPSCCKGGQAARASRCCSSDTTGSCCRETARSRACSCAARNFSCPCLSEACRCGGASARWRKVRACCPQTELESVAPRGASESAGSAKAYS